MLQEIPGELGAAGGDGDTEACGDAGGAGAQLESMAGDGDAEAFDGGQSIGCVEAGEEENKLLAANAGNDVGFANRAAEEDGDFAEHGIATSVTVAVIEQLEVVEVEDDNSEVLSGAGVARQLDFSGSLQAAAIQELGERVDHGLAIEVKEEAGVHHPDEGEREHGAGDDVDDAAGDFDPGGHLGGHFAGDEEEGDAGELNGGIEGEERGHGAAGQARFAVGGDEQKDGGERGFNGKDGVLQSGAGAHVAGDAPGEEERQGAKDEQETEPAGAHAAADERGDADIEAAVADGRGFHENTHGEPVGKPVPAQIEHGSRKAGDVATGEPAEAAVFAILQGHAGEDDGEAGELHVLDEADGVGQHDLPSRRTRS